MRFNLLFVLVSLACFYLALAQVSYEDCCLGYAKKHRSLSIKKHAVKYREQEVDGGCNIPAIIFTMRKGRVYCTDPKEDWVKELMVKIDKRGRRTSDNSLQRQQHRQQLTRG